MEGINLGRQTGVCNRCLGFALALSFAFSNAWSADRKIPFNIPASTLPQAISAFNEQAGVEILYASYDSVGKIRTHAVVGVLSVPEALTQMLDGIGFIFEFENERSISLRRKIDLNGAAVVDQSAPAATHSADESTDTPGSTDLQPAVPEVVVTGSYIHGLNDIVSPLIVVDEREKRSTAYGTIQDVMRTLPVAFGGGQSEDYPGSGNYTRGSAINLRGLGSGATLVLVDGRRQTVSGTEGDFVDVAGIPWSLVDRIEVLPDGASALYGSDAIAGVVNIILRQDLQGAEGQARLSMAQGGADETLAALLFAPRFGETGKSLFAYQYSERGSLATADRAYAANSDKRPLGGSDFSSFNSNPGNILDPATLQPAFAIPPGQDGASLTSRDLLPNVVNSQNLFAGYDLLPYRKIHSVFFSASDEIDGHFSWFAEGRFSHRHTEQQEYALDQTLVVPASNPFFVEPFGGLPFVLVGYSFLQDLGPYHDISDTQNITGTAGLKRTFNKDWQATLAGSYANERMRWTGYNVVDPFALDAALADSNAATAFNPFGAGSHTNPSTLETLRSTHQERADSTLAEINLVADGSLFELPGGEAKLAIGTDYRREGLNRKLAEFHDRIILSGQYGRQIESVFAEFAAPLASHLSLSLAGRYEHYSDFGGALSPKLGLRWSPTESLRFRSSWGAAFKAPTLINLHDTSQSGAGLLSLSDPISQSGRSIVLVRAGNNEHLREETATTWTMGLDFAPIAIPGLTISSTYFVIDYKDRAWRPGPPLAIESVLADNQWASLVTRNPSQAEIDAICKGRSFFDLAADCAANPPTVIVDGRVRNLSKTVSKGIDVEIQQLIETRYGAFRFGLNGSYLFSFEQALTPTSPLMDIADTVGNPPTFRFRNTAEWHQHRQNQPGFGASLAMDYTGLYQDIESSPRREVTASTTFDLQLSYRTPKNGSGLNDIEFTLNAINVFDQDPPFVNRALGYDFINAEPYGRMVSFYARKNW